MTESEDPTLCRRKHFAGSGREAHEATYATTTQAPVSHPGVAASTLLIAGHVTGTTGDQRRILTYGVAGSRSRSTAERCSGVRAYWTRRVHVSVDAETASVDRLSSHFTDTQVLV